MSHISPKICNIFQLGSRFQNISTTIIRISIVGKVLLDPVIPIFEDTLYYSLYDIPQINWKIIMYIHQFYSHKHNNLSFLRKFLEFHHKSNFPENSMTNVFRAVLNIIYGDVVFPEYQIDRVLLIPLNDFIAL